MSLNLAMIITAAGQSTRHPPNKLLKIFDNKTVIEHTINHLLDFSQKLCVVLGYQQKQIAGVLERGFGDRLIYKYNPQYQTGLSGSVITGIKAMGNSYDYWCFCPGDKPFIQRKTIIFLLEKLETEKPMILAPLYKGEPGHPAFFSTKLEPQFMEITGDEGGRQIINNFKMETLFVPVKDEGVILDMDQYLETKNVH